MKRVKNRNRWKLAILAALTLSFVSVAAHEEGHEAPGQMPPVGPHGGEYTRLTHHYGEAVITENQVMVYILEKDVKHVAEDATGVSLEYQIPGAGKKPVVLSKKGDGYSGSIDVPSTTRRLTLFIECTLDGKKEKGSLIYEIKR